MRELKRYSEFIYKLKIWLQTYSPKCGFRNLALQYAVLMQQVNHQYIHFLI